MKLIDRAGRRYGRLMVVRKHEKPKMWICACDCGQQALVIGSNLDNGSTRSCGCLAKEWASFMGSAPQHIAKRAAAATTHGQKRRGFATPEYKTWLALKRRCYDANFKDYPNWGGRGIRVCDRWRNSFENFFVDMGRRPLGKTSIDRKDGNLDYSPENCRWADAAEQGDTKRTNLCVTFNGTAYPSLRKASAALGLKYTTVHMRIRSGMTVEQALSKGVSRAG